MIKLSEFYATLFYTGKLPRFQASIASLIGSLAYYILIVFNYQKSIIIIAFIFPLFLGLIAVYYYQKHSRIHDPKEIVLDEFFAAALIPLFFKTNILLCSMTLIFYRIIDILKPGILNRIDKLNHWTSIFIDDFTAVIIAIGIVWIIHLFIIV